MLLLLFWCVVGTADLALERECLHLPWTSIGQMSSHGSIKLMQTRSTCSSA